ncbi:hypothetical protein AOQ84DRAFT_225407 [Glonium stellatum]|uniref:Uncharacterized protein n=1 Tax=Glonium stellatum TaxID=574774 RepID=A0A8E2EU78_9PEZI|nr:hypothetical protein AOQ84DRAFT_225407 [Glonium stellatum]
MVEATGEGRACAALELLFVTLHPLKVILASHMSFSLNYLPPHFQNIDAQCKAFGFGKPEGCDSFYDRTLNGTASPHRATQGNIPNPTKIVANLSSAYQIMNTTQRSYPVDKYSVTRFSFLVPKHSDRTIDYITSTIAINGTCKPISQKCNLRPENSTALFNCSGAFSGQLGQDSVAFTGCTPNIRGCVAARVDTYGNPALEQDREIIVDDKTNTLAFLLGCQVIVYNLNYTWVDGALRTANLSIADDDSAAMTRAFMPEGNSSTLPNWGIQFAYMTQVAALSSTSSQELANNYAAALERMVLALSASSWTPVNNTASQIRDMILVTKVSKWSFSLMVGLSILYIFLGLGLGLLVSFSNPTGLREVQARLDVFGLTASKFEDPNRVGAPTSRIEDMYAEREGKGRSVRLQMVQTEEGGWDWMSKRPLDETSSGDART